MLIIVIQEADFLDLPLLRPTCARLLHFHISLPLPPSHLFAGSLRSTIRTVAGIGWLGCFDGDEIDLDDIGVGLGRLGGGRDGFDRYLG